MKKQRMLLLGGTNSAYEIKDYAKNNNVTLVATGKYPKTLLKDISEERYDVDAADEDALVDLVRDCKIDAIYPGSNEDIVPKALDAAVRTGLPHYCELNQWELCMNKTKFKELCIQNGIPVARRYDETEIDIIEKWPVVVKPADGCGSQGFCVCHTKEDLLLSIPFAANHSRSSAVIIEDYIPYDAVIIHYTLINGEVYFSGISDKKSASIDESGPSIMALQLFPSRHKENYCTSLDQKVQKMFQSVGMHDGPVWIEAFAGNGTFFFNEMGYRFGGSMTYHPVRYFYGIDQLELSLEYALHGKIISDARPHFTQPKKRYCILPIHIKACTIASIVGAEEVVAEPDVYAYVPTQSVGNTIKNDGTVHQVFCYVHILFETISDLWNTVERIKQNLSALDAAGENQLFYLTKIEEF